MRLSQVVRPGPGQCICEEGALKYLPEKLEGFDHPYIISGEKSLSAFKQFFPDTLNIPILKYDGSSSDEDMLRLSKSASDADVIIGIGGGRALDTAKGTADLLDVETIMIPTVIGTCAAATPLAAVYYPNHSFKKVAYYKRSAHVLLMDLSLLANSPKAYFIGGIGDTLAKWYESEAITRDLSKEELPVMVKMGLAAAKETHEVLLRDTQQALENINDGKVTAAFQRVVESVIPVAGMVGGCAGEYGRMAGAHAIHNAMSYLPETHEILHGVKVAYGILVQLAATGDGEEVARLMPFYQKNGFPYNFRTLGITTDTEQAVSQLSEFSAGEQETFNLAVKGITPEKVAAAIRQVEAIAAD